MNEIHVDPNITDPVIKVNGLCYQFDGPSQDNVDAAVDSVHQTCLECEAPSPSPSPSPIPVPQACPAANGCGSCPDTLTVTISGIVDGTFGCPVDCTSLNGVWTVTKLDGVSGDDCIWVDPTFTIGIQCFAEKWQVYEFDAYGCVIFDKDNLSGCPATGSYTPNFPNGVDDCDGSSATCVVS